MTLIKRLTAHVRQIATDATIKASILTLLLLACSQLRSQSCGSCTVNITNYDTLAYTVSAGQTFCIDSTGQFEGTITLSGGTICNKGIFNPKLFTATSGNILNYSCLRLNNDLELGAGLSLTNSGQSTATVLGDLRINGGTLDNAGISSIYENAVFSAGTFSNSAIVNCKTFSGAGTAGFNNSGIINKD